MMNNIQCVKMDAWCDGFLDCTLDDDEIGCADSKNVYFNSEIKELRYEKSQPLGFQA